MSVEGTFLEFDGTEAYGDSVVQQEALASLLSEASDTGEEHATKPFRADGADGNRVSNGLLPRFGDVDTYGDGVVAGNHLGPT